MNRATRKLPGALYSGDRVRFEKSIVAWPADVRDHALRLATAAFDDGTA